VKQRLDIDNCRDKKLGFDDTCLLFTPVGNRRCNNWPQTALTLAAGTQEAYLTVGKNIAALRRIEKLAPRRHSQELALHGGDHEVGQQLILLHVDRMFLVLIVSGLCYLQ